MGPAQRRQTLRPLSATHRPGSSGCEKLQRAAPGGFSLRPCTGVGRAARHTPQHSRNTQRWLTLIHRLGRAKPSKEASMVLETKLRWPPLQLLQRPTSTRTRSSPHLLQALTGRQHFQYEKNKMSQLGKDRSGWGKRLARGSHLLPQLHSWCGDGTYGVIICCLSQYKNKQI